MNVARGQMGHSYMGPGAKNCPTILALPPTGMPLVSGRGTGQKDSLLTIKNKYLKVGSSNGEHTYSYSPTVNHVLIKY